MMIELMTTNYVLVSSPDNLSQCESLRVKKIGKKAFLFSVMLKNFYDFVFSRTTKEKRHTHSLRHKNDKYTEYKKRMNLPFFHFHFLSRVDRLCRSDCEERR
jgi:hypothetical protein